MSLILNSECLKRVNGIYVLYMKFFPTPLHALREKNIVVLFST